MSHPSRTAATSAAGHILRPGSPDPFHGRVTLTENDRLSISADASAPSSTLIIPGLVNAHAHSGTAVLRGVGDGLALSDWLSTLMNAENSLSEQDMRWSLSLAMCEMIRAGITSFADMFHWTESLIETVIDAGMRVAAAPAVFGPGIAAYRSARALSYPQQLDHIEGLARAFHGHPLVRVMYGPHAVYTCGEDVFRDVARRAADTGLGIHVHLSETQHEVDTARRAAHRTPIESAAATGLLGPRTLVAHAVKPTENDIDLLARSGSTVAHNPRSNLKLGSGIAPVSRMRAAGVPIAIGTDGPASNDSLDMLSDMRLALSLSRGMTENAAEWGPADVLEAATVTGATALGFDPVTLADEDPADFVILRAQGAHATPMHSAAAFLGWVATSRDVSDVVVDGRWLLRDGRLQTIDEDRVLYEARRIAERLGNGAGRPDD